MGKTISATMLRSQLSNLLDQLKAGETHFVIERNNQPEAVLLNMAKFQEIMQMLEMINRLEFIGAEPLEPEIGLADFPPDFEEGFMPEPDLQTTRISSPVSKTARSQAIESAAARLGIRLIK